MNIRDYLYRLNQQDLSRLRRRRCAAAYKSCRPYLIYLLIIAAIVATIRLL